MSSAPWKGVYVGPDGRPIPWEVAPMSASAGGVPSSTTGRPASGLLGAYMDPQQAGLLGLASGLLQASGPSPTPTSLGQAFGHGLQTMTVMQQRAAQNQLRQQIAEAQLAEAERRRREAEQVVAGREEFRRLVGLPPSLEPMGPPTPQGQYGVNINPGSGLTGGEISPMEFYAKAAAIPGYEQMGAQGIASMMKPGEGFTLGPGQVRYDARGNVVASGGVDPEQERKDKDKRFADANVLRDEFNNLTKDFRAINDSYSRIQASTKNPSPAGDLSMIFNYMKMLDPGSVVRESEFAAAAKAGSYGQQIQNLVQRAISGTFTDEMRADFVGRANMLYQAQERNYGQIRGQYGELAKRAGLDPKDVLPEFRTQTEKPGSVKTWSDATFEYRQLPDGTVQRRKK